MWRAFALLLHFFIDSSVSTKNMSYAGSMFQVMWNIPKVKRIDPKHIEDICALLRRRANKFLPTPRNSWDKVVRRGLAWLKIICVIVASEEKDNEITKENRYQVFHELFHHADLLQ